eukprot:COSAG06_NODE_21946_length_739_cov_24.807813_3_plen_24_part_01
MIAVSTVNVRPTYLFRLPPERHRR